MQASEDQLRTLMSRGLDGDREAYAALLGALLPMLRAFFGRRMRGAADDVEDLVQETMLAVHTRRATYDRQRAFTAWAYSIARYKMIDHFRRTRRTVTIEGLEEVLATEGFENACAAGIDVERLLSGLPPKQARAIHDTKIAGLSVAEAARASGLSEADVKVSVHRGLKAISVQLGREG